MTDYEDWKEAMAMLRELVDHIDEPESRQCPSCCSTVSQCYSFCVLNKAKQLLDRKGW